MAAVPSPLNSTASLTAPSARTRFAKALENTTAGVPAAPIYDIAQVVADPHIGGAREMFVDIEHPVAGKMKITGSHIKLSETPTSIRKPSPALGENIVRAALRPETEREAVF